MRGLILHSTLRNAATLSFLVLATTGVVRGAGELPQVAPQDIDAIFAPWNRTDSPGCALAVAKDGEILYEHGYGMADLSHGAIITPATPFHVASVSKQFTAAALVLLAELGRLSLDAEIHRYLPELPDFGHPIRVADLLHHTSGLRDQWDLLMLAGYRLNLDLITDEDVMHLVARQRALNFKPESEYLYSNTGFTIAGRIVQRIKDVSLRAYTQQNLFAPLGMQHTHFRDDHSEVTPGEALGYERGEDGAFHLSVTNFDTVGPTSLYTTVEDLVRWDQNFYTQQVGGPTFIATMTQTAPLSSGAASYYALGLMRLSYRGLPVVEHSGADAGYRADFLRFPEQHFSAIALCNTPTRVTSLTRRVADLYLRDIFPEPSAPPFREPDRHAAPITFDPVGAHYYRSRSSGTLADFAVLDRHLMLIDAKGRAHLLAADDAGHFLMPGAMDPLHPEPSLENPERLVIQGEGKPQEVWERLPAYQQPRSQARQLAGRYYSAELDAFYTLHQERDVLILERPKYAPAPLTLVAPDVAAFPCDEDDPIQCQIRFLRNRLGHISGFEATTGRVRNLIFARPKASPPAAIEH